MTIPEVIASVLLVLAAVMVVATAVSVWRAPDALTRVNLLGPTVGLALPMSLLALFVVDTAEHGFSWIHLVEVLLTLFGVWIVGSVGSFYMGRSVYGVTVTDVKHARRVRAAQVSAQDTAQVEVEDAAVNAEPAGEERAGDA